MVYDNISGHDIRTVGLGGSSRSRGAQTAIVRGCTVASLAAATRPGQDTVDRQRRQVGWMGRSIRSGWVGLSVGDWREVWPGCILESPFTNRALTIPTSLAGNRDAGNG